MLFEAISGFRLVAADPVRISAFYRALGFDVGETSVIPASEMELLGLAGSGSRLAMSLGQSRVDLDTFDQEGRPYPRDALACDLIFQHLALVTDDAETAWIRARDAGATPISRNGPIMLPKSAGGVTAIKFRDPEGHPLEILQFPPDADHGWNGTGIMGIDHSAISVRDVVTAKRFYASRGLSAGHATLNHGPTQVALDGLDVVEVDVVPMNPAHSAPHVELLRYRYPAGCPTYPLASNDIAATRIVWRSDVNALVRDLDGHLHQLSR